MRSEVLKETKFTPPRSQKMETNSVPKDEKARATQDSMANAGSNWRRNVWLPPAFLESELAKWGKMEDDVQLLEDHKSHNPLFNL